jgi:metal-responsive CopG/Arc/MetJ family transcriptional regulator
MKPSEHVAVRLDETLLARVDALIPQLSEPWHAATRSEVLRKLILTGLDLAERDPSLLGATLRAPGQPAP